MWTLHSEQVINMVNCAMARIPREQNFLPKMLEIGEVLGEITHRGMIIETKDIFQLNELTFHGQAGFAFRYLKTATWFFLTASPLSKGCGLVNRSVKPPVIVSENTIVNVSNGHVAILLKQEGQYPILVTLTTLDVMNEVRTNDSR